LERLAEWMCFAAKGLPVGCLFMNSPTW
jgi:hypothetical protein